MRQDKPGALQSPVDIDKINELLGYGLSAIKIARALGYSSHIALNIYIKKRELRPKTFVD